MKELLKRMKTMESEMEEAECQSDYWMQEEHFDMEKSDSFEAKADLIYQNLYKLFDQAADRIVSITSGQIDKAMAMIMIRCRREDVERIFA